MHEQNVAVWILGFFVSWGIIAIFSAIFRAIGRLFSQPEPPPDPWQQVKQTLATQLQYFPDGRCMRAELKWVECDPPMAPNNLEVHNTMDPNHNPKTCKHCNQKPRYSGVSHTPSN